MTCLRANDSMHDDTVNLVNSVFQHLLGYSIRHRTVNLEMYTF